MASLVLLNSTRAPRAISTAIQFYSLSEPHRSTVEVSCSLPLQRAHLPFCIIYFLRFCLCSLFDPRAHTLFLHFILFLVSFFCCCSSSFYPYLSPVVFLCFPISLIFSTFLFVQSQLVVSRFFLICFYILLIL